MAAALPSPVTFLRSAAPERGARAPCHLNYSIALSGSNENKLPPQGQRSCLYGFHAPSRNRGSAQAHARFRRRARAAARVRSGKFLRTREHSARAAQAGAGESPQGRVVGAAIAEGIRRHGAADRRLGRDLRGSGALAVRPAVDQLLGARRRQHESARARRHAGAEGMVAAADRGGQGEIGLRHDRTGAGRRLRSGHDADARREEERQMGDQGPQMVHHRRRRRGPFRRHRAHVRRQAPRADGVSLSPRPAGLAHHPPHPDHGTGRARRPLRTRIRRP